ncbi:hypothetical protein K435DRAFT_747168 [Dendrothele bispora CBS 962.96]|uniref:Uncharacterized protein n=1 Tax=Dendrothele bispora (strain CBS 962.96) TaxID=1314807 RepID=A0A4S8MN56_DENBC|nr:hypothetical protein K435DRAFT_747168 [Dendrothele bispora CBS 962.96]
MQLKNTAAFLAFFATAVVSKPLDKRRVLDVWSPKITSPTTGTVWEIGNKVNVTWCTIYFHYFTVPVLPIFHRDTSNAPALISNAASVVLLVNDRPADVPTLAQGFDLRSGFVEVIVPDVTPGIDYSITLFGDSGNVGEKFAIVPSTSLLEINV